ncbi:hypothetical protein J4480_03000 [Candidatus Woesearchaeota archaeon]|nr:hypothetical protein [Candidatus Woesearchaeota archaeon]
MKQKIIIDLDVVTVGKWDKGEFGDVARRLIKRVGNKEFELITPFYLIEHLVKWDNIQLKEKIENFYLKESTKLLSNEDVDIKIEELGVDDKRLLNELKNHNIKEEDAFIVLFTAIFDLDYLITFNRVHLRNNKETINEVIKKNGLKSIKIVGPEEV